MSLPGQFRGQSGRTASGWGGAQTSVLGHLYLPVAYDFLPLLGVVGHPPPDGGPGALDGVVGGCCTLRPPLYVRFVCLLFPL
jgi:hypothetical protein